MDFLPLAEISPYRRNWVIKGRITDRTTIREFNRKDGGSGKVFKVDMLDTSGDIQVNFWGESADKFNYLQKGDVITLKGATVKLANKKYNNTSSNYELHSESNTEVGKVDATELSQVSDFAKVTFTQLAALKDMELPAYVDLLVMVKSQEPAKQIPKGDRTLFLRNITAVDQSEHSLQIAVWDQAFTEETLEGCCLAIKKAGVKDYNSRTGNANIERITVNPANLPAADRLKQWWESGGAAVSVTALSDNSGAGSQVGGKLAEKMEGTLRDLKAVSSNMTSPDRLVDFSTVAYLSGCRTSNKDGGLLSLTYNACSTCKCKKQQDSEYCAKCNKLTTTKPRYLLTGLTFEDGTAGRQWASSLEDTVCSSFLGMSADEAKGRHGQMDEVVNQKCFSTPYNLKFRLKVEEYQGDQRVKASVTDASPLSTDLYASAGQSALKQMAELYNGLPADTQASVKALLAGLPTVAGGRALQPAWQAEFTALRAVVA
jgi:replication factor A1